ncbi:MAG: hypothetical protein WD314_14645 [Trueperaceae bacterium]
MASLVPIPLDRFEGRGFEGHGFEGRGFEGRGHESEIDALQSLAAHGLPVAPTIVVPGGVEEEFYRLNNLGSRLEALFAGVDPADPDDDDVEDLAPEAERLVGSHYLLDEFIDRFYEATVGMPHEVRVRRPGHRGALATRGRESLLALKRTWSADWSFENLWERLAGGGPLLPSPGPVLVQPGPLLRLTSELERDALALAGRSLELFGDPDTGITLARDVMARRRVSPE